MNVEEENLIPYHFAPAQAKTDPLNLYCKCIGLWVDCDTIKAPQKKRSYSGVSQ